jgi:hypothetical protein
MADALQDRVSLDNFPGADPSGTRYSDAALAAALAAGRTVLIPAGKTFRIGANGPFKVMGDGRTIECLPGGKLLADSGVMLDVYGAGFTARNLNATGSKSAISAVQLRKTGTITGGRFDGDWIYPIALAADGCSASGFTVDGRAAPRMNSAILVQASDNFDLHDFVVDHYQGFGIHVVNQDKGHAVTRGWKIRNGRIRGRRQVLSVKASPRDNSFDFGTDRKVSRFGIQVDSRPVDQRAYRLDDLDGGSRRFRLRLPAVKPGETVSVLANASLEAVNIGSRVGPGTVTNVISEDAGDSGFVVCDDEHTGAAFGVVFEGCEARGALYAGFAEAVTGTHDNRYLDCVATRVGQARNSGPDIVYSSGFLLSGSSGEFRGGRVINDGKVPTARYGIVFNGNSARVGPSRPWSYSPPRFEGPFDREVYYG